MIDLGIRHSAFTTLDRMIGIHGEDLPWEIIAKGFEHEGKRFLYASRAEGIFKPAAMDDLLSVKTTIPRPGRKSWYEDQAIPLEFRGTTDALALYAFKGTNPDDPKNILLKRACERSLPVIYFTGVAPSVYRPVYPTFLTDWNPVTLNCRLRFSIESVSECLRSFVDHQMNPKPIDPEFSYRTVRQRLFQSRFRQAILSLYSHRCAMTGLPEPHLIDAAHIVEVGEDESLATNLRNGICISKIHHAAFDRCLIGIDPDYKVRVSRRLLSIHDGPMLEQGLKAIDGKKILLPSKRDYWPDPELLEKRFKNFIDNDVF